MSNFTVPGEFFDATMATYNDKSHGKAKIDYSLTYGIAVPIDKYIEELEEILKAEKDDKTEKRKLRLVFLQEMSKYGLAKELFIHLTTWLNGGKQGVKGEYHEDNNLIIIMAGGNIITIFAKLIHIILTDEPAARKIVFLHQTLTEETFRDIKSSLSPLSSLKSFKLHFIKFINHIKLFPLSICSVI